MNGLEGPFEARALAVEAVDDDQAGKFQLVARLPGFFGLHLNTRHCIDDDQGRIGHSQRSARVREKVCHPGRIDEVDLGFVPLDVREARGERMLAGDFLLVEVGHGGAFVDLPESG